MEMIIFWLLFAFFFLLLEMGHPGLFFFLSLFVGCCAAAITAISYQSMSLQSAVALGMSIGAAVLLHCWIKQRIAHKHSLKTNVYALQGKKAVVTQKINPATTGQIKVDGQVWSAKSFHNQSHMPGDMVEIVSIQGCHAMVKALN